jgi:predicted nucleic acid-binding protein
VRLFLDTSVLLAASGSSTGASREIFRRAAANRWALLATPYAIEETLRNLPRLPTAASADWARLRPDLVLMDDVVTLDRPTTFAKAKDRPILFSALA